MFTGRNYIQALGEFLKLEKKEKNDAEIKHCIGTCYLNIHDDKAKALPYLEFCYKAGKYKNELLLELAMAYQYAYKFSEAISFYNKYREKASSKAVALAGQNPNTGKYIFIIEPGKYRIKIEAKGFPDLNEDITIYDESDFVTELEKNFMLQTAQPLKPEELFLIKNLFPDKNE